METTGKRLQTISDRLSEKGAEFLSNPAYLAAASSHFFVDVLNNGRVPLVAFLAVSLGLSNAQLGIYLVLYNLGGSLSQPLFGWLADRFGARWLVVGGLGWMISFYATAALLPGWPALGALTLASLGSGAFHPSGTKVASQTSTRRRTQATALFFMSGQIGLFVGPIVAGTMLDAFDRIGFIALPGVALFALLGGWRWLTDEERHGSVTADTALPTLPLRPPTISLRRVLPAVVVIIVTSAGSPASS
jgi:FSR family fosmidomycin resistance protein-like MFS transporter